MDGRGPALGVLDDAATGEARLQLAGDDRLLLYSDGLVERGRSGLQRRARRAARGGRRRAGRSAALLDAVLGALNPPGTDDVTLLGIART